MTIGTIDTIEMLTTFCRRSKNSNLVLLTSGTVYTCHEEDHYLVILSDWYSWGNSTLNITSIEHEPNMFMRMTTHFYFYLFFYLDMRLGTTLPNSSSPRRTNSFHSAGVTIGSQHLGPQISRYFSFKPTIIEIQWSTKRYFYRFISYAVSHRPHHDHRQDFTDPITQLICTWICICCSLWSMTKLKEKSRQIC